jgi:hypothetical protein
MREVAATYDSRGELDPGGFSGAGIWWSPRYDSRGLLQIELAGLVTHYDSKLNALVGFSIEEVTRFLGDSGI